MGGTRESSPITSSPRSAKIRKRVEGFFSFLCVTHKEVMTNPHLNNNKDDLYGIDEVSCWLDFFCLLFGQTMRESRRLPILDPTLISIFSS